jgi:peptidoglycan/LPS O-acetylase OafA/YrhL
LKSSTSQYFSRLDHLRFFAALLVLVWHAIHYNKQIPTSYVPGFWPASLFEEGHTGVSLFMTLSGFIFQAICRNQEIVYREFLRNRLLRIAPLFLVWTFFYFYTTNVDATKLFVALVGLLNRDAVPGVGWTIVIEFQFYVLFPFLLAFTAKYGLKYLCGLIVLAVLFRWGVWYRQESTQMLSYWTIFGRIDQFIFGMIGCELFFRKLHWFRRPYILICMTLIWVWLYHRFNSLGGFYEIGGYPSKSPIWIILPSLEGFFYALITASYLGWGVKLPVFVDKSVAWLGSLSFSLYLNHFYLIEILHKLIADQGWIYSGPSSAVAFALLIVLPPLVVVSAATYYLIELPFLSFRRNYFLQKNR